MTDGGPQKPGESDRDYARRLAEHIEARRKQKNREMRGDPRAHSGSDEFSQILNDDALLDNLGRRGGKGLQDDLSNMLGSWRNDIDSEPLEDLTKNMADQAAADLAAYRNTSSKSKKKRLAKKNKKAWTDAAKKNKNGCAVAAVMMLGALGGAGWALFEAGSAIVSAMGG
jgi:hypothetical protein